MGNLRVSFQKFYQCDESQVYYHNHPWYKEMLIVKGCAKQGISSHEVIMKELDVKDDEVAIKKNEMSEMILTKGSMFSIKQPNAFHYLYPINGDLYCVMINTEPWFKGPKSPSGEIKEVSPEEREDIINTILNELQ